MTRWILFLRAINLGSRRRFSNAEILECLERAGFGDLAAVYGGTGNVRVSSPQTDRRLVEAALEDVFARDRGFEVPVIAFSPAELSGIAADVAELALDGPGYHYVNLTREPPDADVVATVEALGEPPERVVVRDRAVHLLMAGTTFSESTIDARALDRVLGLSTSRTGKVLTRLSSLWCDDPSAPN